MPSQVVLQIGTDAPLFELADADMHMFNLEAQRGKNIVLYFYPKDDTPGCTMEANEFSDHEEAFTKFDSIVVGISRDDCISHASFRDKHGLSVQLLADPDGHVCKKYGVLYEKETDAEHGRSVNGHKKLAIQRSTFIIDKKGKLRHVLYGVHAHGHPQEILKLIKEMK
jgi:thioredoxin-dependent peroxiredoxin